MLSQHTAKLEALDAKAAAHRCTYQGKNVVDKVNISIDHVRLTVTVTRSREGGFVAAVTLGGYVKSAWGRKASDALCQLGSQLRAEMEVAQ